MQTISLTRHPATASAAVDQIEVQVVRPRSAALELRYTVSGDLDHLLIPAESLSHRADKLWQHTCFEAFVAAMEATGYHEFNFSPSTEWAIYRFSAYREGMTAVAPVLPPRLSVHRMADRLTFAARIDLESLPELRGSGGLRLGLSAVIEGAQHGLTYWALAHPPGKPDFHHPDGFALTLPAHADRPHPPNPPPRAGEGKGGG
jgi:hypothetical protein